MRRVELIIKPQNNTESFFVWKTHNFFHVFCSREDWEWATIFFCFLGDDSSSNFFPFNFFLFHKKTAILFSTIFATLWSQILEKIALPKNIFLSLWISAVKVFGIFTVKFRLFERPDDFWLKMRRKLKQSHSKFQQRN